MTDQNQHAAQAAQEAAHGAPTAQMAHHAMEGQVPGHPYGAHDQAPHQPPMDGPQGQQPQHLQHGAPREGGNQQEMFSTVTGQNYQMNEFNQHFQDMPAVTDYQNATANFSTQFYDNSELMNTGSQQLQYIQDTIQSHQVNQEQLHQAR